MKRREMSALKAKRELELVELLDKLYDLEGITSEEISEIKILIRATWYLNYELGKKSCKHKKKWK